MKNNDEKGVSRTTVVNEPAQFVMKIESFSLLSKGWMEEYESDVFQAGGYKWKLLLYPQGNEIEDGEEHHISLYLVIADTTSLPTGWNVLVNFKFFVYNHAENNYLCIQVADGMKTQFHALKTKVGFSKFLSFRSFEDSSNGYLYNDSCVFGADVFVTPKCTEMETCLYMIEPPSWNNTYSWIIENFLTIEDEYIYSEEFKVGKLKWKLLLYPNGDLYAESDQHISIYLEVSDYSLHSPGWRCYAKFKLRVKDQVGHNHKEVETCSWFGDSNSCFGIASFMLRSELNEGLLMNGNIIAEAEISVVGTIVICT